MTEAQLQAAVLELCKLRGLLAYHTHDSRRSEAGFPDLVIAGTRGVIFAELKTERGELSAAQVTWKWRLLAAQCNWKLWRPEHLQSGLVLRELKGIT